MERLLEALQIPDTYTSYQGSAYSGMESMMIMLRRLTYPSRWCDLVPIFGRAEPELSMAFNMVIMKNLFGHKCSLDFTNTLFIFSVVFCLVFFVVVVEKLK